MNNENQPAIKIFGAICAFFLLIETLRTWLAGHNYFWATAAACILVLIIAWTRPDWLKPLLRVWMLIGKILHHTISPIVLGLIYLIIFVPLGLAMRAFKRDQLKLIRDRNSNSYWESRQQTETSMDDLRNQF